MQDTCHNTNDNQHKYRDSPNLYDEAAAEETGPAKSLVMVVAAVGLTPMQTYTPLNKPEQSDLTAGFHL